MSTLSQDNYVMETQVQQEEWAKQKENVQREEKEWLCEEGDKTIQTSVYHSVLNVYFTMLCHRHSCH